MLVVSVIDEQFRFSDLPYRVTNSTEGWAYALRGDFKGGGVPPPELLREYDLVLANLDRKLLPGFSKLIRQRPSDVRWVSTIEGGGGDYLAPDADLLSVLDASDVVSNINRHTTAYLQSLTNTPVHWIGVPYPGEDIAQFAVPYAERCGDVLICPKRDAEPSWKVAELCGVDAFCFVPTVSRQLRNARVFASHRYVGKDVLMRDLASHGRPIGVDGALECGLEETWRVGSRRKVWINLDPRYTWSRWVLDGAALGVPVISTVSTAHSCALFPELTVPNIFAIDEAAAMVRRLLGDEEWYHSVCLRAAAALAEFLPDAAVQRLECALGERVLDR